MPIVLATQETDREGSFGPRSLRPAWTIQLDPISLKNKLINHMEFFSKI